MTAWCREHAVELGAIVVGTAVTPLVYAAGIAFLDIAVRLGARLVAP